VASSSLPAAIDRYRIAGLIGRGRRSTLYRAWDPKLDRHVAIKLHQSNDNDLRQRLAREARLVARLQHPNIVRIHDIGDYEGRLFTVMELVEGRALSEIISQRAPLAATRKLELMSELCDGLGFVHDAGVVHRNIKPANLMVEDEGRLKLLDFGLARSSEPSDPAPAGRIVGTLNYMSPEQMTGQPVDRRSDIFAVGAVMYELLSCQQAFPGGLEAGILYKILYDRPAPLPVACPDADAGVVRIVERCLEKEPRARYQDLASLRSDLEDVRARLGSMTAAVTEIITISPAALKEYTSPRPSPADRGVSQPTLESKLARGREAEEQRIAAGVRAARARIDAREFSAALQDLRALAGSAGARPEISGLVKEAEAGLAAAAEQAVRRAERAAAETAQASELLARKDLGGALARVIAALACEPGFEPARVLRGKIQDAIRTEMLVQRDMAGRAAVDRERWEAIADTIRPPNGGPPASQPNGAGADSRDDEASGEVSGRRTFGRLVNRIKTSLAPKAPPPKDRSS
jgi:serine/threonine-protein kinase